MKIQGGLGKGFDSLLPQNFDNSILVDETERIQKLALADVQPNPDQPRKHFDKTALGELSESIKRYGILQPIVVKPSGKVDHTYVIVAGERRYRAAKQAGLTTIPAIVRTSEELEHLEVALVENVQRVDLSPLEQAASIYQLHTQFNIGYETIAKRLGKAQATISNTVRLLQLPVSARKALEASQITEGHARAILAVKDDQAKEGLLKLIIKNHWNVRQAEQFALAQKEGVTKTAISTKQRLASTTPETKRLSTHLGVPVSIKRLAKGGKLEIRFKSDDELERIISKIS
jgi:ParB family transcriptional regulator, chromosome partitioning protein